MIRIDRNNPGNTWTDILKDPSDAAAIRGLLWASSQAVRQELFDSLTWNFGAPVARAFLYEGPTHLEKESDFFADTFGEDIVSRAQMVLLQRQYSLSQVRCTTTIAWDKEKGQMVHFRSLDWAPMTRELAAATRILNFEGATPGENFSAAGILGMVGLLTAVRKNGFSVVINYTPTNRGVPLGAADPTFMLRELMENPHIANYRQAVTAVETWKDTVAPVFISLCGVDEGDGCIIEFGREKDGTAMARTIRMSETGLSHLVGTNHYRPGTSLSEWNCRLSPSPEGPGVNWDRFELTETSWARQEFVMQALKHHEGSQKTLEETLVEAYSKAPVWNCETFQWAMMTPKTGDIKVWARR
ncbi:MAG: hypothetical protein FJX37_01835 [Alphaproteobacteria bacterium]|nr:hypothetical protein [Alphaproteobacteria bacterium]MBM3951334.1 hypothetical protein [Rhodospirillales bacterium]